MLHAGPAGQRFYAFDATDHMFARSDKAAQTTWAGFSCACLNECAATEGCKHIFLKQGASEFSCFGLAQAGELVEVRHARGFVSESWSLL